MSYYEIIAKSTLSKSKFLKWILIWFETTLFVVYDILIDDKTRDGLIAAILFSPFQNSLRSLA